MDFLPVAVAKHRLQHHPDREREAGDLAYTLLLEGR
jgi:hypothetical protein